MTADELVADARRIAQEKRDHAAAIRAIDDSGNPSIAAQLEVFCAEPDHLARLLDDLADEIVRLEAQQ